MTPQALKASILQLAIQGKLVPQRPEEGTAEELYQQIQAEKQRLIAEGKIKKEKPLPPIEESEIPFEIPETWKWLRLGNLIHFNGGYAFKSNEFSKEGVRVIRISDFSSDGILNKQVVRHKMIPALFPFSLQQDDIILCMTGGTVGKSCYISHVPEPLVTNQRVGTIRAIGCLAKYIYQCVVAPHIQEKITQCKNSTNDNISAGTINSFLIPLPPHAEQKRIVAKIEEMLPLVERYGEAYEQLQAFNKRFPDDLRKSILQEAIQGKLVPQRPEEGTAEELYQQIQAEKKRLIASGTIKKEKPLPPIEESEIPFDIPETWKWVQLGDIVYNRGQKVPNGDFSYIDIGSINNQKNCLNKEDNILSCDKAPSRARKIVGQGDILYATVRPYLHNVCIIDRDFSAEPIASTGFAAMSCIEGVYNKYLFYYLLSPEFDLYANRTDNAKGVAYPAISDKRLYKAPIALPPYEEQKRIAAKIEKMLQCCKTLQLFKH